MKTIMIFVRMSSTIKNKKCQHMYDICATAGTVKELKQSIKTIDQLKGILSEVRTNGTKIVMPQFIIPYCVSTTKFIVNLPWIQQMWILKIAWENSWMIMKMLALQTCKCVGIKEANLRPSPSAWGGMEEDVDVTWVKWACAEAGLIHGSWDC